MPAGDRAVVVPAAVLEKFLSDMHFTRTVRYHEVVYERVSKACSHVTMRVNTSIHEGASKARGLGKDSIKVSVTFERGKFRKGISKDARVYRTGTVEGVLERIKERMTKASATANEWIAAGGCFECKPRGAGG